MPPRNAAVGGFDPPANGRQLMADVLRLEPNPLLRQAACGGRQPSAQGLVQLPLQFGGMTSTHRQPGPIPREPRTALERAQTRLEAAGPHGEHARQPPLQAIDAAEHLVLPRQTISAAAEGVGARTVRHEVGES
jgi:hypothetical protein